MTTTDHTGTQRTDSTDASTIALITGANKGLGREAARRLAERGWRVFLAARDLDRGKHAADELSSTGLDVEFVQLDVTSDESVATAAATVAERADRLDVLINNAGVGSGRVPPLETGAADFRRIYEVNVFGPVRVTRAFLPLLRASANPRVVMVSSGMGSLTLTSDPDRVESTFLSLVYPSSKTALNMITSQYARALPEFRINAADPGYTATDLNNHSGFQTVTEGTDAIIALADIAPDGPTGRFFDRTGPVPW
jgi:NAD(P)-dependent dehydrogenase (short-subunit alcohol dehydrogenase family)